MPKPTKVDPWVIYMSLILSGSCLCHHSPMLRLGSPMYIEKYLGSIMCQSWPRLTPQSSMCHLYCLGSCLCHHCPMLIIWSPLHFEMYLGSAMYHYWIRLTPGSHMCLKLSGSAMCHHSPMLIFCSPCTLKSIWGQLCANTGRG